ncbi:MAG: preprotein translocase subunit SecE [bacterium]
MSSKKKNKVGYIKGVKAEMQKVSWPEFKDVVKYTIATLVFIFVVVSYFLLINLILSMIIRMVG